ncbi:MAG: 16S rRNA (cytosine(1402)-N(4))-methyltransferase RsmH [Eubacterium sp.]|nr:16S rRNA (cytosine(1402)-N(4))-methyltransferase RsmH [Eubacterium sp.]
MEFQHKPVLLKECIEQMHIRAEGVYVDGTIGGAGHAKKVCERLSGKGRLIGIDRDEDAVAAAKERLISYKDRVTVLRGSYRDLPELLAGEGIRKVDGILLDLGVSSHQLDSPARGFTYRTDAPLDMRMDRRQVLSAFEVVNTYGQDELYRVIRTYGEERFAGNIARRICAARAEEPIRTTGQLADIIRASIPAKNRREGGHPAKRTFQAIRIEVNGELEGLEEAVDPCIDLLNKGGRLCVITFHSLEDRIIKNSFRRNESPCVCPPDFPVCVCGKKSKGFVVTRHPILPTEEEQEENPRSASAKLRVFERTV